MKKNYFFYLTIATIICIANVQGAATPIPSATSIDQRLDKLIAEKSDLETYVQSLESKARKQYEKWGKKGKYSECRSESVRWGCCASGAMVCLGCSIISFGRYAETHSISCAPGYEPSVLRAFGTGLCIPSLLTVGIITYFNCDTPPKYDFTRRCLDEVRARAGRLDEQILALQEERSAEGDRVLKQWSEKKKEKLLRKKSA